MAIEREHNAQIKAMEREHKLQIKAIEKAHTGFSSVHA